MWCCGCYDTQEHELSSAEVRSLLQDMDATHGEAEACAQELMLAQDQLRAARAELHLLRSRVQEAEHQVLVAISDNSFHCLLSFTRF